MNEQANGLLPQQEVVHNAASQRRTIRWDSQCQPAQTLGESGGNECLKSPPAVTIRKEIAEAERLWHIRQDALGESDQHTAVCTSGKRELEQGAPSIAKLLLVALALQQTTRGCGPLFGLASSVIPR
eukprot:scaffold1259_cov33-Tisochrysis_lutea.AAC.2